MRNDTDGNRTKVWDPVVRIFHWGTVVLGTALVVTAHLGMQEVHVTLGIDLLVLLGARLAWGLFGTPHARFASFVPRPAAGLAYLREVLRGRPRRHLGHNPAGGLMVVALLITLALLALSGLFLQATLEFDGPLVEALRGFDDADVHHARLLHDWALDALYALVPLHLLGVALASIQHRENLVWSMVTGFKPTTTR